MPGHFKRANKVVSSRFLVILFLTLCLDFANKGYFDSLQVSTANIDDERDWEWKHIWSRRQKNKPYFVSYVVRKDICSYLHHEGPRNFEKLNKLDIVF